MILWQRRNSFSWVPLNILTRCLVVGVEQALSLSCNISRSRRRTCSLSLCLVIYRVVGVEHALSLSCNSTERESVLRQILSVISREALEEISVHLSAVILVWTVRQL